MPPNMPPRKSRKPSPIQTNDGRIVILAGVSRSGKTAYAVREAGREKRAIAWDAHDQWGALPGWKRVTSPREFFSSLGQGAQRLAYVPTFRHGDRRAQFEAFAAMARFWIVNHGPGVVIVEELADVTTTAKAPQVWGYFLREVLKRGGVLYCIAQRWAEADKTALSQRTEIVVFAQGRDQDVEYLAREMRVEKSAIDALIPQYGENGRGKVLPYLKQDRERGVQRGELRF